jgi:hypothetical protein
MNHSTMTERPIFWFALAALFFASVTVFGDYVLKKNALEAEKNKIMHPIASDKVLYEQHSCKGVSEENARPCLAEKARKYEAAFKDEDYAMVRKIADRCNTDEFANFLLEGSTLINYLAPRYAAQMGCSKGDSACLGKARTKADETARETAMRSQRAVAALFINNPDAKHIFERAGCYGEERREKALAERE